MQMTRTAPLLASIRQKGVEQPKKSPNKPGSACSDALLMSRFQDLAADAAKKKTFARFG